MKKICWRGNILSKYKSNHHRVKINDYPINLTCNELSCYDDSNWFRINYIRECDTFDVRRKWIDVIYGIVIHHFAMIVNVDADRRTNMTLIKSIYLSEYNFM